MTETALPTSVTGEFEDEISLLDLITALGEEKRLIAGVAGFELSAGAALNFCLRLKYLT